MTMKRELTAIVSRRSGNGISFPGARTALSAWFKHWRTDRADKAVRAPIRVGPWTAGTRRTIGKFQRRADYKSAIRQSATLRYFRCVSAALRTSRRLLPSWEGLGVGCLLTKFSRGATSFGARNLFRLNARWSRGAKSLQSLCAVREVMRTEVRAPVGCGSAALGVGCSMFDVRCFAFGGADLRTSRPASRTAGKAHHAFSLIEMIGVLAVIAILATALAPSFVRPMDKTAGDQDSAALKSFGDALQQSIMRNRYTPSDAD